MTKKSIIEQKIEGDTESDSGSAEIQADQMVDGFLSNYGTVFHTFMYRIYW